MERQETSICQRGDGHTAEKCALCGVTEQGGLSLSPPRQSLVREAGIVGGGAPVGALQTLRLLLCYINVEEGVGRPFSLSLYLVMASIVRGLKLETSRMTPAAFTESNTHTQTHSLSLSATDCPSPICRWRARDSWTTIGSRAGDRLDRSKST